MKVETNPSDGLILVGISKILYIVAWPLDSLHEFLKQRFVKIFKKNDNLWKPLDKEGVFIELWALIWMFINVFIILQFMNTVPTLLKLLYAAIIIMRLSDFSQMFINLNLYKSSIIRRSVSRSYILLFFAILEVGAILSSIHFLISDKFRIGTELANWENVYYYTLRNIFTVGGGDIFVSNDFASFFFGVLKIVEPMFGVLVLTTALTRAIMKPNEEGTE